MSDSIALFVLGPPGVGKTTVIRQLVPSLLPRSGKTVTEIASPKWTITTDRTALAGHWRGTTFDGGDTVPYTGARAALEFWRDNILLKVDLTIFDGDRFSTKPSLEFIRETGVRVLGVHLGAADDVLAVRRAARASNQNETWLKGRVTKASNFAELIGAAWFSANPDPAFLASRIREWLDGKAAA